MLLLMLPKTLIIIIEFLLVHVHEHQLQMVKKIRIPTGYAYVETYAFILFMFINPHCTIEKFAYGENNKNLLLLFLITLWPLVHQL